MLGRHLRPHQKEGKLSHDKHPRSLYPYEHPGVQFLYECVMGLRKHEGQGCILADEMYVLCMAFPALLITFFSSSQGHGQDSAGTYIDSRQIGRHLCFSFVQTIALVWTLLSELTYGDMCRTVT